LLHCQSLTLSTIPGGIAPIPEHFCSRKHDSGIPQTRHNNLHKSLT
jgi:hypothetical protein